MEFIVDPPDAYPCFPFKEYLCRGNDSFEHSITIENTFANETLLFQAHEQLVISNAEVCV